MMRIAFLFILATAAAGIVTAQAQTTVSLGLRLGGNLATRSGDDPNYVPNTGTTSPSLRTLSQQDYTRQSVMAPQFGAVLNVSFGKLALQPAVLFSQKGVEQRLIASTSTTGSGTGSDVENYHLVSRPNYLEVPINLVYTTGTDHGFQLLAGPYLAVGVGGRAEVEWERNTSYVGAYYPGVSPGYSYNDSYTQFTTFFTYHDQYPGPSSVRTGVSYPTPFTALSGATVARRFDAGINFGIGYRFRLLQLQLVYGLGLINQQPDKSPAYREEMPAYYQRVAQLHATYFFNRKAAPGLPGAE